MARVVTVKLDALQLHRLVKVDSFHLAKAPFQVTLVKEHVAHRQPAIAAARVQTRTGWGEAAAAENGHNVAEAALPDANVILDEE